jgi:hypothetical protein
VIAGLARQDAEEHAIVKTSFEPLPTDGAYGWRGGLRTPRGAALTLTILLVAATASGRLQAQSSGLAAPANPPSEQNLAAVCAQGAVNGLITVSVAALVSVFAEIALPTYPVMLGVGLGVGCPVRIVGTSLKGKTTTPWHEP